MSDKLNKKSKNYLGCYYLSRKRKEKKETIDNNENPWNQIHNAPYVYVSEDDFWKFCSSIPDLKLSIASSLDLWDILYLLCNSWFIDLHNNDFLTLNFTVDASESFPRKGRKIKVELFPTFFEYLKTYDMKYVNNENGTRLVEYEDIIFNLRNRTLKIGNRADPVYNIDKPQDKTFPQKNLGRKTGTAVMLLYCMIRNIKDTWSDIIRDYSPEYQWYLDEYNAQLGTNITMPWEYDTYISSVRTLIDVCWSKLELTKKDAKDKHIRLKLKEKK